MKGIYKKISILLIFIVTLITCNGCFKSGGAASSGPVGLIGVKSTTTIRYMDEDIYIGYLGSKRDFALIVDNAKWSEKNGTGTQECGENGNGCASTMAKLLMYYGIKTSHFTDTSASENVLLYYTTSDDFNSFGSGEWYTHLTDKQGQDYSNDDDIWYHSCSSSTKNKTTACTYSSELSKNGYSKYVGNSMILLFHDGKIHDIIRDAQIDPNGVMNKSGTNYDDLNITNTTAQQEAFASYYSSIISTLKSRVHVVNASNVTGTSSMEVQEIKELNSLGELEKVVNDNKAARKSYLLLLTSNGFVYDRFGINTDIDGKPYGYNFDEKEYQEMSDAYNTITSYLDNCALESSTLLETLLQILEDYLVINTGAAIGAGAGAAIGMALGSVVPGIGTTIGAIAGGIIGGILGARAALAIRDAIEEKLRINTGIAEESYCKIMTTALTDIEINVPIYMYNIDTAENNINKFKDNTLNSHDSLLFKEYQSNASCAAQRVHVKVQNTILSKFAPTVFGQTYAYADECEAELVHKITGGLEGSPSLQFYLNGKKVDALNGRVSYEVVNEMMGVWGLQDYGDLYTIGREATLGSMKVTLGSGQEISNVSWCASNSDIPSCDGLTSYHVNVPSKDSYIGIYDISQGGIKFDFRNEYINYSRANSYEELGGRSGVNSMTLNTPLDTDPQQRYYYKSSLSNNSWNAIPYYPASQDESDYSYKLKNELLIAIKDDINSQSDSMYQVKYGNAKYILLGNGHVVGYYESTNSKKIVYYKDSENEYAFTNGNLIETGDKTLTEVIDATYLTNNMDKNDTLIRGAHKFYIYVKYTLKGNNNASYFSYVV